MTHEAGDRLAARVGGVRVLRAGAVRGRGRADHAGDEGRREVVQLRGRVPVGGQRVALGKMTSVCCEMLDRGMRSIPIPEGVRRKLEGDAGDRESPLCGTSLFNPQLCRPYRGDASGIRCQWTSEVGLASRALTRLSICPCMSLICSRSRAPLPALWMAPASRCSGRRARL